MDGKSTHMLPAALCGKVSMNEKLNNVGIKNGRNLETPCTPVYTTVKFDIMQPP